MAMDIKAVMGMVMDMDMDITIKVVMTAMAIRATVMGTLTTTITTTTITTIATVMGTATVGGGTASGGVMESAPAGAGRPTVTYGFVTRRARCQRLTKKLSNVGAP